MSSIAQRLRLPTTRTGAYTLIIILALAVRLAGWMYYGVERVDDALEYEQIARNLVQGHGYSLSPDAPFAWTTQREPGYPLFLASIYFLFGYAPLVAVLLQCLLGALACLLIYETALLICEDRRIALWAGLANAVYVPIAIFSVRLISETVALTAMAAVAFLLVRLVKRPPTWRVSILLGLAMGYLALTKLTFLLLPGAVLPLVLLWGQGSRRARFQAAAMVLATTAAMVLPWFVYNYAVHGTISPGTSVRVGANIYCRVADDGMRGYNPYLDMLELEKQGVPTRTINEIYLGKAWEIVRDHPIRYALGALWEIRELWRFGLSENELDARMVTVQGARGAIMLSVKYFFQAINIIVLITGVLGFFVIRNLRTGILVALIGYSTVLFSLISCASPRYNVAVLPLMLIFSSIFMFRSYQRLRQMKTIAP